MGYVVNEDRPTDSARVHDETCGYYTNRRPKDPGDGGWLGPFETRDEALVEARSAGHSDVRETGCCLAGRGILGTAKSVVGSAKRTVRRSADVMSGEDIRRFEEFTDAVATTVTGIHRDQSELRERLRVTEQSVGDLRGGQADLAERLSRLELTTHSLIQHEESDTASLSHWTIAFGVASVVALVLSIVAMAMATF